MLELLPILSVYFKMLDPMAALLTAAKFAALGFVLALGLAIICVKFKLFQRRNKYWNIAAKLYYPYIFIVCISVGACFGLLQHVKVVSAQVVASIVQPVQQVMVDSLKSLPIRPSLSLDTLKTEIRERLSKNTTMTETIGRLPTSVREWAFEIAVDRTLDHAHAKIADATGLDKKTFAQLRYLDLIEFVKSDYLSVTLRKHIHKPINDWQNSLLLMLLLFMAVPALDIFIARRLAKREAATATA